jgi:hypothetical protein
MKNLRTVASLLLALLPACATAGGAAPSPATVSPPAAGEPAGGPEEAFARLEMLVGRWDSEARARRRTGEVLSTSATAEASWDLGGRFVRVRTTYRAGPAGAAPPESTALFTWDESAALYRTWTFHSSGEVASGSMSYDADTRTWSMAEVWTDPVSGARGTGRGFMRFSSDDEKSFGWERRSETDPDDSYRVEGTSRRLDAPRP